MRIVTISALVAAAVVTGGVVLAHENANHAGMFKHHVTERINSALDAAKATPEQRATLDKTRDRVFAALEASHQGQSAHMQKVMELFVADRIDPAQLKTLRDDHEATARADGDAIVKALVEAHDTLQPSQRSAVAENLRAHKPEGPPKMVADWFKKKIMSHVNEGLDSVKASAEQRTAVENAIEQVLTAVHDEHEGTAGHMEAALKLFEADRIDQTQLDKLRADTQARHQKIGDAVVQAFHDVHDVLTAAQRKQLVAWVQANHPHLGG